MTCSDYFAAIPWPAAALAVVAGFTSGALLALYLAVRHPALLLRIASRADKEKNMTAPKKERRLWRSPLNIGVDWLDQRPPLRAAYNRLALIIAILSLAVAIVAGGGVLTVLYQRSNDSAKNAVVNCQNANESRRATLRLWTFLFDTSLSNPNVGAQQRQNIEAVEQWIAKLYAQRDCSDLSRKYPIPPPPVITPVTPRSTS